MACGDENSDASAAAEFAAAAASGQDGPLAWYGDSAYGTGELRAALAADGQRAVIKPGPLRPAVPGGFTIDDFAADHAAGTVTCPAGITRRVTRTRAVTFGAACRGCPLRRQRATAKDGRALTLHQHDALLRAARAEWPAIRDDYRAWRPNVERAVAQVATQRGRLLSSATAGSPPTTPGSGPAPQPSTSATSSAAASPATTEPGSCPPDGPGPGPGARPGPLSRAPEHTRPQAHLRRPHGNPARLCPSPRVPTRPAPNPKPA